MFTLDQCLDVISLVFPFIYTICTGVLFIDVSCYDNLLIISYLYFTQIIFGINTIRLSQIAVDSTGLFNHELSGDFRFIV